MRKCSVSSFRVIPQCYTELVDAVSDYRVKEVRLTEDGMVAYLKLFSLRELIVGPLG